MKREPAFTEEHERAVAAACEKLWNGEPVDDPIHSPRRKDHPLCVVGNAAHKGLNAALAMRTQLLHAWREIDTLRAQLRPGDPRVTTHHADCWQTRGHHACAIAKIEALTAVREPGDTVEHLLQAVRDLAALVEDRAKRGAAPDYAEQSAWRWIEVYAHRLAAPPTDGSGA